MNAVKEKGRCEFSRCRLFYCTNFLYVNKGFGISFSDIMPRTFLETTMVNELHSAAANGSNDLEASVNADNVWVERYLHACGVLNIILLVCIIWIVVSMIVYGLETGKFESRSIDIHYVACFTSVSTAIPKVTLDVARYYLLNIKGSLMYCELVVDIDYFLTTVAIFSSYLFLWFRQRHIFSNPFLKMAYPNWINLLSRSLLFVILGAGLIFACMFIIPESYTSGDLGCIFIPATNATTGDEVVIILRGYALTVVMVIGQIVLLGLFIYPLTGKKRLSSKEGSILFIKVVRRCTICASVAIFSDIVTAILSFAVIPWSFPVLISHTVYNVSISVNAICIVSTFGKNTKIFFWKICRIPFSQPLVTDEEGDL